MDWESSLDIDDSDLPSLLHPCNHHPKTQTQIQTRTQTNFSNSQLTVSNSQPISKTLLSPHSQSTTSASPRTTIPGPAGAVQSAMLRKACAAADDGLIPSTQEYIRRAVEEGEEDGDFNRNPWLCALQFLGHNEMVESGFPSTRLSSIKKCLKVSKVDQVVAVIKSCMPNGLGDLVVNLKDPTGTIGANIHHKVLAEAEFGKEICVGSVLILRKVAVFAPSRSARYLNITLGNVVKVISKDSGPPLEQKYVVSAIKPILDNECSRETGNVHILFSSELDRTEEIGQYANVRGTSHNNEQMENENPLLQKHYSSTSKRDQNDIATKDDQRGVDSDMNKLQKGGYSSSRLQQSSPVPSLVQNHIQAASKLQKRGYLLSNHIDESASKLQKRGYSSSSLQYSSPVASLDANHINEEIRKTNGVEKQRQQPVMTIASLPEWTDEQLNELFAADCEDGGSLF